LGVIMRIFSQGMSRVGDSDYYARAVMLAESKLAQLGAGIPLEEGEVSGESDDALRWRVRLAAYDSDKAKTAKEGGAVQPVMPVRLLQVEVEVSRAGFETTPRSIRLVTLKLAPRTVL
jgi:general secretion pathway protein I